MGCPRKDKPVTNSQKCLSYQKKLNREEYLQKERERKWLQHSNLKEDPTAYKKYLQKDHQRKKQKDVNMTPPVQPPTLPDNPTITPNQSPLISTLPTQFNNRASLQRSVNKATLAYLKVLGRRLMWFTVSFTTSHHHQEEIWAEWWDASLTNLPPQSGILFYLKKEGILTNFSQIWRHKLHNARHKRSSLHWEGSRWPTYVQAKTLSALDFEGDSSNV